MPRHKNNPTFDPAKLEAEVLKTVIELFNSKDNPNHDISFIADELQIPDLKARKLLITAGERDKHIYYSSPLADQIQTLRAEGRSLKETEEIIHDITKENLSQVPASRGSNKIEFIVVHYLGVPNADNPYLYGGGYGGHYNIQRDGSVYKAADPKTAVVWHCGGGLQGSGGHTFHGICTNYNSIGIECGVCYSDTSVKEASGDSDQWYFTTETQESLVWLVAKLMKEYGIGIDHVIRHYDVTGKICPNPYVKNNKTRTSWTWDEFLARVKQQAGEPSSDEKQSESVTTKYYRVRKSWAEKASQIGAFTVFQNAKNCVDANPGYAAFDDNGNQVYPEAGECRSPL